MIRKAIIVVLTLAALGLAILSMNSEQPILFGWPMGDQEEVWVVENMGPLRLMYFRDFEPSKPGFHGSWGSCSVTRKHDFNLVDGTQPHTVYVVDCPTWVPVVVLAVYPTLAFIRAPLRRWRRRRRGLCIKCGYDLTGNESGVCPECGEAV